MRHVFRLDNDMVDHFICCTLVSNDCGQCRGHALRPESLCSAVQVGLELFVVGGIVDRVSLWKFDDD